MNKISSQILNNLTDTAGVLQEYCVCFRKPNLSYLSHDNLKKQLPAHFYGHAIIVMNILCLGGPKAQGQKLSFLIWMHCFHWLLSQILIDNNKLDKASIMTSY